MQIPRNFNLTTKVETFWNNLRTQDPQLESLGKVDQASRRPMKVIICLLLRWWERAGMQQICSSMVAFTRAQEADIQRQLFSEGYITEISLQKDLMFTSHAFLNAGDFLYQGKESIDFGLEVNRGLCYSLMCLGTT